MLNLMMYRLKVFYRDKTTFFWSLCFPFLLGTLFFMAFGNISSNTLECIDTALIIEDESMQAMALSMTLESIKADNKDFISVEITDEETALEMLKNQDITAVIYAGEKAGLAVMGNGIKESIIKSIIDSFNGQMDVVENAMEKDNGSMEEISAMLSEMLEKEFVEEASFGDGKIDGMLQYYLALVSMTCMFCSFIGVEVAMSLQANVKPIGARRCVSGTKKSKLAMADLISMLLVSFLINVVLLVYLRFVLKLEIGNNWPNMLLTVFLGSSIGISIGFLVGSINRLSEAAKSGILTAFGLLSSALSGLMIGGVKGLIEENAPIINRINPASVITDALYSSAMFEDQSRFYRSIIIMAVMAVVLWAACIVSSRRVKYDSI